MQLLIDEHPDFNFKYEHYLTDLDERITPLAAAAFLGRWEMVNTILGIKNIDVNITTDETCKLQIL